MIRLQKFVKTDFDQLIAEVTNARFLLQFAGPQYIYPLDMNQLNDTLAKTIGDQPSFKVFKAIHANTSEIVGHIQLMDIDYSFSRCVFGRVLIFQNHRGNGFGKAMLDSAVKEAFYNLGIHEITLSVFDFNISAIATYKSLGFVEYQFNENARQFQAEKWNVIKMRLNKNDWLKNGKC